MYSQSLRSAAMSSPTISSISAKVQTQDEVISNHTLSLRLQELMAELRDTQVQLSNEVAQCKRAEQALNREKNLTKILASSIFIVFSQWITPPESKIVSKEQSIFPSNSQLNSVFQFIEDNYHQPINLTNVAKAVGYSPAYLTNLTKRYTNITVHGWIVERRMAEARSLLFQTDDPVYQIAAKVGYPDSGHFIRQFRQLHEIPPKAWRDAYRISSLKA